MSEKLDRYRRMRDFEATPEPAPRRRGDKRAAPRFVVQEHSARRLHWDLRLERDGVAVSWAIPNAIPLDPRENRLAVHTEDHPLEYMEFEGEIPAGSYGAGTVRIWDRGTYECEKWEAAKVMFRFYGERLQGRYALFRTGDAEKDWMIHRIDPPPEGREPFPQPIVPMRPCPGELPENEKGWATEILWGGARTLAYCQPGRIELRDSGLEPVTALYPEVRQLSRQLGAHEAVLDGEIVAFDEDSGAPSAERLAKRAEPASESAVRRRAKAHPVTYVVYDLLFLDGRDLTGEPYELRRRRLEELELAGPAWQTPARSTGAAELLAAARERGLAGIVLKRLDSAYRPGLRSDAWLAVAAAGHSGGTDPPHRRKSATAVARGGPSEWYAAIADLLAPHFHDRASERDGVELRVSLASAAEPERPTALAFELVAAAPASLIECCQVAVWLRGMLEQLGLRSLPKTAGPRRLQVFVPLNADAAYEETQPFARSVAETLEAKFGDRVTAQPPKPKRGKVLVDWSANEAGATTLCAYSLIAGRRRLVSTPLEWGEVEAALAAEDAERLAFDPAAALERVERRGDLFAPVLSERQQLP